MDKNFDKHTLREVHFTAWLKNGKVENNGNVGLVGYFPLAGARVSRVLLLITLAGQQF